MKVKKSTNNRLVHKINSIYRWTDNLDEERCKQLNIKSYVVETLRSIREQLVDKQYTASINQATFITEVYKDLRSSFGVTLHVTPQEIFGGPE